MIMLDQISLGSQVTVKVVKQPTNTAAQKTLVRVLSKDAVIGAENARLRKVRDRHYTPRMRGGRLYSGHMVKLRPVKGQLGESGTVTATHDVLADLRSVERFIEVGQA